MNSNVKVSIITPIYNSEKFIDKCIESVLNQTYNNWEMLLVNDYSSDNSIEIVKEYQKKDSRIKLFHLEINSGAAIARNLAIEKAEGEIIAFLDSDDVWTSKKLEIHVDFMVKNNTAFSHTSYGFIDEEGKKISKTFHVSNYPVTYKHLLKRTEISCLTAMYDVRKTGKMYMPDIRRKQDYGLWLSILKKGFVSLPLDLELAFYRQRKGSATNNKFRLIRKHYLFLNKTQGLGFLESFYYSIWWGLNGVKKYYINRFIK